MGNRAFHAVVVLLWCSTMGWLLVSKVLPPLMVGEPPTLSSTLQEPDRALCWRLEWRGQSVGWAASKVAAGTAEVTEVHSRMVLHELPVKEMAPYWLRPLFEQFGAIDMDVRSRVEIDPLGALSAFHSTVRVGELKHAVRMRGHVEQSDLLLEVRTGELFYKKSVPLTPNALVGNELSPQAELPHLRLGQTWTMPVYNPFYPNQPMEVLQALVESESMLTWGGQIEKTFMVTYRPDSGAGLTSTKKPRGTLWVAADGRVLQQETSIFNSQLRFIRMTDEEAETHLAQFGDDWLNGEVRAPAATVDYSALAPLLEEEF